MQTAIEESIDPRAVLEALDHLKSGMATAMAAENALLKSKAERLSALRRESQRHAEADAGKLDLVVHALSADFNQQLSRAQDSMEARTARIQQLYHSSRTSLARRIQAIKDLRIGQMQGSIMRRRQERQLELAQATEHHLLLSLIHI